MNEIQTFFRRYFLGAAAYGSARKILQLWDAKTYSYSGYNEPPKPMPLGDKLGVFTASIIAAPYITPIWVVEDLNYLDVYMRGHNPDEFFQKKMINITGIDYIFM
jgi:hypothetical protein